jgi:hypothetical protein
MSPDTPERKLVMPSEIHGGLELARAMLGHADVRTTKMYVGDATLDELAIAVHGLRYDRATPAPVEPQVTPVTRTQSVER